MHYQQQRRFALCKFTVQSSALYFLRVNVPHNLLTTDIDMRVKSIFSSNLFRDKVAIVTGGATGIGAAIANELCYLGCNVMIASRNTERLKAAANAMTNNSELRGKASYVKCNIRSESDVKTLTQTTLERFGKIDYLVNNGGGQFISPAEHISVKGWNAVIETNMTGTFYCSKQVYLDWMSKNGGAIVNITADNWRGIPGMAHTSAARAGVDNLTKTLSLEWAENKVRVNSIASGVIDSSTARANYAEPEMFDNTIKQIPASRLGLPEEISSCVCFLLSPAAEYITGETLKVDGGGSLYGSFLDAILRHIKRSGRSTKRSK